MFSLKCPVLPQLVPRCSGIAHAVFLTQLSQPQDTRNSPGLSQVSVRENTHIVQYLVSQDTQDSPRTFYQAWIPMDPEILSIQDSPG